MCWPTLDLGPVCVNLINQCSKTWLYCTSTSDCEAGLVCLYMEDGCGGCDSLTQGKGICNPRC